MEVSGKRLDEDTLSELCEPCQEGNVSTHANGYCIDCEEYMCQTCFSHHVKMKMGKNHVFGAITGDKGRSKQNQEEKCKKHTREAIKYYCCNHDSVGCGDCIVSDHGACKPEFIRDLAKKFEESSEFKSLLKQIQKWEVDKAESETRIESNRKENKTNFCNAIKAIKKFRSEINIWLDKIEKSIEAEVKEISDGNEMRMSDLEQKINKVSDEIGNIKRELDTNVNQADKLFIRTVECKPKIRVVEKSVSEIKSDDGFKIYSFEPETKFNELLTSSMKLGIVKVTSGIKTENTPTTEAESSVKNVYELPDGEFLDKCYEETDDIDGVFKPLPAPLEPQKLPSAKVVALMPAPLEPQKLPSAKVAALRRAFSQDVYECDDSNKQLEDLLVVDVPQWLKFNNPQPEKSASCHVIDFCEPENDRFYDAEGTTMKLCYECNKTFPADVEEELFLEHQMSHFDTMCFVCKMFKPENMTDDDLEKHVNKHLEDEDWVGIY